MHAREGEGKKYITLAGRKRVNSRAFFRVIFDLSEMRAQAGSLCIYMYVYRGGRRAGLLRLLYVYGIDVVITFSATRRN